VVQLVARRLIGELAVRDGWADRSIELLLRAALAAAVDRELDAVAARCRTLLRDGGFAVPRFADGGSTVPIDLRATGVTAREMEIVRHLVAGRTTVEIADELFVSVATVRSHIANATHKLGYSSRSELLEGMAALQI
jgi:DNA-binding CsgD family transcriptional regulator